MARGTRCKGKKYTNITFASKFERGFFESIPSKLNPQYEGTTFPWVKITTNMRDDDETIQVCTTSNRKHTPDVTIGKIHLECKGHLDDKHKERLVMFRQMYPDVDMRLVFSRNGKVGGKMTYLRWAALKGFKACVAKSFDELPKEWKDDFNGK